MQRDNRELWLAFATIGLVSTGYYAVVRWLGGVPPARELFGHSLGVIGLVLMLMTEILYSLRKRSLSARWGRPASWLKFHIYTGIVGPYLALLHTAWKFNGLAGVVVLLTLLVVLSGFIGRYIYTAIPRTLAGVALEEDEIDAQVTHLDAELQQKPADELEEARLNRQKVSLANSRRLLGLWHSIHVPLGMALFTAAFIHVAAAIYYATLLH